jgi:isocitrate dehydrogenase kinase/phosphatase
MRFRSAWRDLDKSIAYVAGEVRAALAASGERREVDQVEVIRPVFYQISRAHRGSHRRAALLAPARDRAEKYRWWRAGRCGDAFGRRHQHRLQLHAFLFHVDPERVAEAVLFLKAIMPRKPVSELFTVLGRASKGKTERYRELIRHMEHTDDQFAHAPGSAVSSWCVSTLPSLTWCSRSSATALRSSEDGAAR